MNRILYQHINNCIMAYKSKTGNMPNMLLIPEEFYELFENDSEKKHLRFVADCTGDGKVHGLDIMVVDAKGIQPIRVLKKR